MLEALTLLTNTHVARVLRRLEIDACVIVQ